MAALIELQQITKAYRGVAALKNVDFVLEKGEIHALLGENGAGKSTLTKIIAGVTTATLGTMLIDGNPVSFSNPAEALAAGVAMVFQETSLVPSMSVAQNVFLGDEKMFNRLRGVYIAAQQLMGSLNFAVNPWATVATLGAAQKQMVEIARAVRQDARVIIFDEPTATLTPEEKHHFFALIERLRRSGVSIIFISHAIEEAIEVADRVTILRDGEKVLTDLASNLTRDRIIELMVGRSLSGELYKKGDKPRPRGRKVLSVRNLSMSTSMVRNTSFSVYAGQITGIFGLIGSGRTETAKIIAGLTKRRLFHGGDVVFLDRDVRYRTPSQAVRDGIVYVTEDRKLEGFFESMTIGQNINVGYMASNLFRGALVKPDKAKSLLKDWMARFSIKAIKQDAKVVELSGGNQQKVVIAKSLAQEPKLVIFDEPTRGVDVGAIAEIHQLIRSLADQGLAVVVISSYLPEVLNLSDRILVSRRGKIVEELRPEEADEKRVMYAAVH
jgi:simple sugar transport system ATP-binding protein